MSEFFDALLRMVVRVVFLVIAIFVVMVVFSAFVLWALVWWLRSVWARLRGQPSPPYASRFRVRKSFEDVMRRSSPRAGRRYDCDADVVDVQARDIKETPPPSAPPNPTAKLPPS